MIRKVTLNDLLPYKIDAEKAGLCFAKNTLYFAYVASPNIISGFVGVLMYRNKAVIKNIYVLPEVRGNGIFKQLLNFIILDLNRQNIFNIEATCTKMSIREFERRGFKSIKQYKHYTKVRLEVLPE
jgi:GNAT superfamily N-acetyltransferase